MQSVLIAHPWMGRGGSEATAMWVLQALYESYDVTFVTAATLDWDELNTAYGTSVDPDRLKVIRAPHLPTVDGPTKLVQMQLRYFERFCRGIAKRFDLCISAYNPIDFGSPGIQLIGDFSFSEEMRKRLYIYGEEQFRHRDTLMRRFYLQLADRIGVPEIPLKDRGDLILSNSGWCVEQLKTYFHVEESQIIYPPVILRSAVDVADREALSFVCLGRVVPEKEIERIISILQLVRERGYPVTLRLMGALDDTDYSVRIRQLIEEKDWITPEGFMMLDEKQAILSTIKFAIHACRIEAFGIAVAEMASVGCIPFVPSTGGAKEIIDYEELQFSTDEEAVEKIIELINDPERASELSQKLPEEMNQFGPEVFMRELRKHVLEFLSPNRTVDVESEEALKLDR